MAWPVRRACRLRLASSKFRQGLQARASPRARHLKTRASFHVDLRVYMDRRASLAASSARRMRTDGMLANHLQLLLGTFLTRNPLLRLSWAALLGYGSVHLYTDLRLGPCIGLLRPLTRLAKLASRLTHPVRHLIGAEGTKPG